MTIDWSQLAEIVRQGNRFLLTSHVRPDCDSLGSELGLARVLEKLGKQVTIVNADATPPHLSFIDPEKRILALGEEIEASALGDFDVMIVVDTSAWIQLGAMGDVLRETKATRVVIDHHVSSDDLGATSFKDANAEATGRLIIDVADALGVALDAEMAAPLFAAIATDTGWLRFPSTTGVTFRAMGRLVEAGAKPHDVFAALYEQCTPARLLLRGRILSEMQTELDDRVIYGTVFQKDFTETGAKPGDTEDVVNRFLTVSTCEVAVLFSEMTDGKIKASLRSQGKVDVRQVAEQFGGGGHTAASGVLLEGPADAAIRKILDSIGQAMR